MKLLMLADTHGDIDLINRQLAASGAEACFHCGDLGIFTDESISDMHAKELRNLIVHSTITRGEQHRLLQTEQDNQRNAIRRLKLHGNFQEYLRGEKSFDKPVYAVWGNHEDANVIGRLRTNPIRNLTLLDETTTVLLQGIRFYGIGGDCRQTYLPLPKSRGIPVDRGQIRTAFWQLKELLDTLDRLPQDECRIQISHACPSMEPILEIMAYAGRARLTYSGHMHPPGPVITHCNGLDHKKNYIGKLKRLAETFPMLPWKGFAGKTPTPTHSHVNLPAKRGMTLTIHDGQFEFPHAERQRLTEDRNPNSPRPTT